MVANSLRTFAMAPSYIHFYLLDCRQDLFNKEQSSSQDRATMPAADVAPVAVEQDLACIVGCSAQLPCTADGARGHAW